MKTLSFEKHSNIALIRLQNPPRNAVNLETSLELNQQLKAIQAENYRALVLTGSEQCFCAGMDLKQVPFYSQEQQHQLLELANSTVKMLFSSPIPVITAVNGHAIGAGLTIALCGDYRIGPTSQDAKLGLTEARAGIPFPACPAVVVEHSLSPENIRHLCLYGPIINSQQALQRHIFDELAKTEEMEHRALAIAKDMASIPADSYAKVKYQFRQQAIQRMEEIVKSKQDPMQASWVSSDADTVGKRILKKD